MDYGAPVVDLGRPFFAVTATDQFDAHLIDDFLRVLRRGPPGEALAAKPLAAEQLAEIEAVAPRGAIAGTRYPALRMASLDSEKR